jgi:hypothetical protein
MTYIFICSELMIDYGIVQPSSKATCSQIAKSHVCSMAASPSLSFRSLKVKG